MQAIKRVEKNIGIITLNRPDKLNALNHEMLRDIFDIFDSLIKDDNIKLIILEGSGRAFSAGGDLNYISKNILNKGESPEEFYTSEREIVERFNNPKKPVLSFVSGIIMGGGVGMTIDSHIRIVDETTKWAMPETKIGMIPDIGIGHYFSKMPKDLALYLSLLGIAIEGSDLINLNLADYYIKKEETELIKKELLTLDLLNLSDDEIVIKVKNIVSKYEKEIKKTKLDENKEIIKKYFDRNTLEEIFINLEKDSSEIAKKLLEEMNYRCPLSLEITFQKYFAGKNWTREETVEYDLKLLKYCYETGNLKEGMRALLVDKDLNPKWNPEKLKDVDKEKIKKLLK